MNSFAPNAMIVLVHGAWADGSCWQNIILPLRQEDLQVICAPIPLRSLADDIAALQRVIERTNGPVALAGHAYAGAVIAGLHDDRVKSLVYVAALAPAEGETVADVFYHSRPRFCRQPKIPCAGFSSVSPTKKQIGDVLRATRTLVPPSASRMQET